MWYMLAFIERGFENKDRDDVFQYYWGLGRPHLACLMPSYQWKVILTADREQQRFARAIAAVQGLSCQERFIQTEALL